MVVSLNDLKAQYFWSNLSISYTVSSAFYTNNLYSIQTPASLVISGTPTTPNLTILSQAMSEWSKVVNFGFTAATDYTTARLAIYQVADVLGGTVENPFVGVTLPVDQPLNTPTSYRAIFVEANTSQYLYMHELGHALGLDHPGHGDGNAAGYSHDTTIMSYNVGTAALSANHSLITPMIYDIAAMQQVYGAANVNMTTSGDTTYNQATIGGQTSTMFTLWDAGGTDTIDISAVTAVPKANGYGTFHLLDLRGVNDVGKVAFSSVGDQVFDLALDPATNWTKPIVIENAKGSNDKTMIIGNEIANSLSGGGSNDTIVGGGGNDTISGGTGVNTLEGGANDDLIYSDKLGSNGAQSIGSIFGGTGNDVIHAGVNTSIYGGDGDDQLFLDGTYGIHYAYGGKGMDTYSITQGDKMLHWYNQPQGTIAESWISDTDGKLMLQLQGITFSSVSNYTDTATGRQFFKLACTGGTDNFTYLYTYNNTYYLGNNTNGEAIKLDNITNLSLNQISFADGKLVLNATPISTTAYSQNESTYTHFEIVAADTTGGTGGTGGTTGQNIVGSAGSDALVGGAGADTLDGAAGADVLTGGAGADVFKFSSLTDSMETTTYLDRITDFVEASDKIDLSGLGFTGLDTDGGNTETAELRLSYSASANRTYVRTDQSTFEFYLDGNHSTMQNSDFIFGNVSGQTIVGTSGIDSLTGGAGGDVISGLAGNDKLFGLDGADTLDGGAGIDQLTGGLGADIFKFTSLTDSVHTGSGYDRIVDFDATVDKIDLRGLGFNALTSNSVTVAGEVRLAYSSTNNRTYVRDDQNDFEFYLDGDHRTTLTGSKFIFNYASLNGTSGADTVTGSAETELLFGLAGNDTLLGNGGDDTLDGGAGADVLTGGAGSDVFKFLSLSDSLETTGNLDRITDYVDGSDKIDLRGLGFTGFDTDGGNTEAGELRLAYSSTNNRTYVRTDQSTFEFYLDGNHTTTLTNADFMFV